MFKNEDNGLLTDTIETLACRLLENTCLLTEADRLRRQMMDGSCSRRLPFEIIVPAGRIKDGTLRATYIVQDNVFGFGSMLGGSTRYQYSVSETKTP